MDECIILTKRTIIPTDKTINPAIINQIAISSPKEPQIATHKAKRQQGEAKHAKDE